MGTSAGCAETSEGSTPSTSTETGNPPVIDALKLSLSVSTGEIAIIGAPGAVTPGGAEVTIEVVGTGETIDVTTDADGSFNVSVPGDDNDIYLVSPGGSDDEPETPSVFVFQGGAQVIHGGGENLTCDERDNVIRAVLDVAVANADDRCEVDSDCVDSFGTCDVEWYPCGGPAVSQAGATVLRGALSALDGVCEGYRADDCAEGKAVPRCTPKTTRCVAGQCTRCGDGECESSSQEPTPTPAPSPPNGGNTWPTCEAREQAIDEALAPAVEMADRSCSVDADCVIAGPLDLCYHEAFACGGPVVNRAGEAAIADVITDLEGGPCTAAYADNNCRDDRPLIDCAVTTPICNAGQCQACFADNCVPQDTPGCAPQLVQYTGACRPPERYHWLGDSCQGFTGCTCEGPDCDRGYTTFDECVAAHQSCDTSTDALCGGIAGFVCDADEYCAYVPGQNCGASDFTSICQPVPNGCDANFDPVCGCDGMTYSNACAAAAASMGIQSLGECATP